MASNINDGFARPGDTIEITHEGSELNEQQFVVIETPNHGETREPGCAWFEDQRGINMCARPGVYKIISRGKGPCGVDASLNKQRDNNLREAFGYG